MVYIDDTLAQRTRYISLYEVMRTERGDVDELDPVYWPVRHRRSFGIASTGRVASFRIAF